MELSRRDLESNPAAVPARARSHRNRRLVLQASSEGGNHTTRDYFIREVAFGGAKTAAYFAFGLASIFDMMERGEWHRAEAEVVLLLVATEQAAIEEWSGERHGL